MNRRGCKPGSTVGRLETRVVERDDGCDGVVHHSFARVEGFHPERSRGQAEVENRVAKAAHLPYLQWKISRWSIRIAF